MRLLHIAPGIDPGSEQAESFLSVLHRAAQTYGVTFNQVLGLLAATLGEHTRHLARYQGVPIFIGMSSTTQKLVASFEQISSLKVAAHTFLKVSGVISNNGSGLFRPSLAWCPICIDPMKEVGYGMLAHQLLHVHTCPLHGAALRDRCPSCGVHQYPKSTSFGIGLCRRCKIPLCNEKPTYLVRMPHELKWKQRQMLDLVAYVSNATASNPSDDWTLDLAEQISRLVSAGYEARIGRHERDRARRSPHDGVHVSTLLWLASAKMVSIVDLIQEPVGACNPTLVGLQTDYEPKKHYKPRALEKILTVRRMMIEVLRDSDCIPPSLSMMEHVAGISAGTMHTRIRTLPKWYGRIRRRRLGVIDRKAYDLSFIDQLDKLLDGQLDYTLESIRALARADRQYDHLTMQQAARAATIVARVMGRSFKISPDDLPNRIFKISH